MVEYIVTLTFFFFTFLPVHLLTNVTIVHAKARCVTILKVHKYKKFYLPSIKI